MVERWRRVQRDFSLVLTGVQETVISIADHVNQHVQKVKLKLDTASLERKVQSHQVLLGQKIHAEPGLELSQIYEKDEIHTLLEDITMVEKQLEANEGIVSPHEALHDFERLLIRSDFVVQNVVIRHGYAGIGKTIKELSLPPQMMIFFIKKQEQIVLAYGKVSIAARDEVTFLCSKKDIPAYIAFWQ
ncbi:hypothetical protein MNBD_NITROSPIRAE01-1593 [hydrothermal vent metagenome]|uniref:RCK C-terminal domain-containing protein n=1 Tax=hydrothermal vent metagenome TaxID=652676 RepID=A0A3B1CA33_9ZZZZ